MIPFKTVVLMLCVFGGVGTILWIWLFGFAARVFGSFWPRSVSRSEVLSAPPQPITPPPPPRPIEPPRPLRGRPRTAAKPKPPTPVDDDAVTGAYPPAVLGGAAFTRALLRPRGPDPGEKT